MISERVLHDILARDRPTVVLTTPETAAFWREQVLAYLDEGGTQLETVQVLPLAQWLVALWDNSFPDRQVLRPVQLLALAKGVIDDSGLLPDTVISSLGIARRFADAFELGERFGIEPGPEAEVFQSAELAAFRQWRQTLRRRLADSDCLAGGQLPAALLERLPEDLLELPECIALAPDLEPAPTERALLDACAGRGVDLCALAIDQPPPGDGRQYVADNIAAETDAAARWTAARLREADRALRIALVAPDVTAYEQPLRRALERHAYPPALFPAQLPAEQALAEPWRIGTGRLAGYPVIAIAVDLLHLGGPEVPMEQLSRVLRSSFAGGAGEWRGVRSELDLWWREQLPARTRLRRALRRLEQSAPQWQAAAAFLQSLLQRVEASPRRQLPSAWVRCFDAELHAAGWPNREPGDPVVDQCRRGFSQVMDTLRAMDRQLGAVERGEALSWLGHILQGKRFELSRDEAPPVQILSLAEAAGQRFDRLWLLGLTEAALPTPVEPSPFLPREALRAAGVPRCDAADCLQRDRRLLEQLLCAAPSVVVSYPRTGEEGAESTGCTLFAWDREALNADSLPPGFELQAQRRRPERDEVRPVDAAERGRLRGGTSLFRDFAISPFLAFLKHRLHLREFPLPVEGLDPATQGSWIHGALERFWARVRDSEALQRLDEAGQRSLVEECVDREMDGGTDYGRELLRIERRRLTSLLNEWLAFERRRSEPFTVAYREEGGRTEAWGIPLGMRVDRVDDIGGRRLVIDYKTGKVEGKKLNAEELLEPQLPLYALFASELLDGRAVDGVALAQIHPREGMTLHMRSNWSARLVPDVPKKIQNPVDDPQKWQAELEAWAGQLQRIAQDFLAGDIRHDLSREAAWRYDEFLLPLLHVEAMHGE